MPPPPYAQALANAPHALPALETSRTTFAPAPSALPTFETPRIEPVHAPLPRAEADLTELPSYSAVPRLRAEKLFWYGFACQCTRSEIVLTHQARCCGSSARCD